MFHVSAHKKNIKYLNFLVDLKSVQLDMVVKME